MLAELVVVPVVEALEGGLFDGADHAFDLTLDPGMPQFGQPVLNIELRIGELESVKEEWFVA
jgi:hypothetical protein